MEMYNRTSHSNLQQQQRQHRIDIPAITLIGNLGYVNNNNSNNNNTSHATATANITSTKTYDEHIFIHKMEDEQRKRQNSDQINHQLQIQFNQLENNSNNSVIRNISNDNLGLFKYIQIFFTICYYILLIPYRFTFKSTTIQNGDIIIKCKIVQTKFQKYLATFFCIALSIHVILILRHIIASFSLALTKQPYQIFPLTIKFTTTLLPFIWIKQFWGNTSMEMLENLFNNVLKKNFKDKLFILQMMTSAAAAVGEVNGPLSWNLSTLRHLLRRLLWLVIFLSPFIEVIYGIIIEMEPGFYKTFEKMAERQNKRIHSVFGRLGAPTFILLPTKPLTNISLIITIIFFILEKFWLIQIEMLDVFILIAALLIFEMCTSFAEKVLKHGIAFRKVCEDYTELKNFIKILNSVIGPLTLLLLISALMIIPRIMFDKEFFSGWNLLLSTEKILIYVSILVKASQASHLIYSLHEWLLEMNRDRSCSIIEIEPEYVNRKQEMLMMFLDSFTNRIGLNGWVFCTITYGFIGTMASVVATYTIILLQFMSTSNSSIDQLGGISLDDI